MCFSYIEKACAHVALWEGQTWAQLCVKGKTGRGAFQFERLQFGGFRYQVRKRPSPVLDPVFRGGQHHVHLPSTRHRAHDQLQSLRSPPVVSHTSVASVGDAQRCLKIVGHLGLKAQSPFCSDVALQETRTEA